jgi:carboxyl-terminal processing protease
MVSLMEQTPTCNDLRHRESATMPSQRGTEVWTGVRRSGACAMSVRGTAVLAVRFAACTAMLAGLIQSQEISKLDRGRAQDMLQVVASDIRKHYYDPKFHGVDWDARVAKAKEEIDKATSMDMAISYIAAAMDSLHDSHTIFYPPGRLHSYDFGWRYQMIGDRCYVTQVRPNSDADAKKVRPGDEILTVNGFLPDRNSLWKMQYVFLTLRPQSSLKLLLQPPPNGHSREVQIVAREQLRQRPTDLSYSPEREWEDEAHFMRARALELGDQLMILKMPYFAFSNAEVAGMIGRARKHQALILDLRGNPGGSVETLKDLVGALFEKDVKISDRVMRKETKPFEAKPQHNIFTGKLIVLLDSQSASASELLARLVQIEKRGVILGDRSSGSVMESKYYSNQMGGNLVLFYGESISDADMIMSDGKSLEHVGVVPDEVILPTATDLAGGRDKVMARAAELAGVKLTAEAAGKLFPYEWPPPE